MSANIYATLYEGEFDIGFDCTEEHQVKCNFCLTEEPGEGRCTFWRDYSCQQLGCRVDAIEKLVKKLNQRRREIEEQMEG